MYLGVHAPTKPALPAPSSPAQAAVWGLAILLRLSQQGDQ